MPGINLSDDQRQEARDLYLKVRNAEEVARQLNISSTTVRRFCKDLVEENGVQVSSLRAVRLQEVIALRQAARADKAFNLETYAEENGFNVDTAAKALRGHSFKDLNDIEPPVIRDIRKLDEKESARKMYAEGNSVRQITKALRVSKSSVSLWCRDLIQANLSRVRARHTMTKEAIAQKTAEARTLYSEGKSVTTISQLIDMGESSISRWCKDLIALRRAKFQEEKKALENRPRACRKTNGPQLLTNADVIAIRRSIRTEGRKTWRHYANQYQVGISTISLAARGVTFKSVNNIEPPVTTEEAKFVRPRRDDWKKLRPDEQLVAEAMTLMRSNPEEWTYGKLAEWMTEKTGRHYRGNHVAILLRNRDPSIRDIEPIKPAPVPRVKKTKRVRKPLTDEQKKAKAVTDAAYKSKVRKETTPEERKANADRMRAYRRSKMTEDELDADLQRMIALEDQREADLLAQDLRQAA